MVQTPHTCQTDVFITPCENDLFQVVYCGARLLRQPQLAAAVSGPVRIPPQFESFYTFPLFRRYQLVTEYCHELFVNLKSEFFDFSVIRSPAHFRNRTDRFVEISVRVCTAKTCTDLHENGHGPIHQVSLKDSEHQFFLILHSIPIFQFFLSQCRPCVLCISTSKRVLCMPFAGQNHLFLRINKFFCLFPSLTEKRKKKERKAQK